MNLEQEKILFFKLTYLTLFFIVFFDDINLKKQNNLKEN
jgi:hypothetical protein